MTHRQKEFVLIGRSGKPVRFLSAPFCFEVDEYLRERFNTQEEREIVIDLKDAERDLPVLLIDEKGDSFDCERHDIDLRKQDYDVILLVYGFFLGYKRNAYLRQLQYSSETLAFEIEQAKKVLNLMPEIISAMQKK